MIRKTNLIIIIASLAFSIYSNEQKIEKRAFISNLNNAIEILIINNATVKSHYSFKESIYKNEQSKGEYYRIREYYKNSWKQKKFTVTHKSALKENSRANSLHYEEFDYLFNAENSIAKEFQFQFSFKRSGTELKLGQSLIYVEDIDFLPPTVEIVTQSHKEINFIFKILNIENIDIFDDSVPLFIERKIKNN